MKPIKLCWMFLLTSCSHPNTQVLEQVLNTENEQIKMVMDNLEAHEVQIMLTKIDNDESGTVRFKEEEFQVDDVDYFYPASTVKFPIALLALEKVNEMPEIDSQTLFYVEGDSVQTTLRKEIVKIFATSDNAAYNRLFEFLGTNYVNQKLKEKGLQPARVSHRLSTEDADAPTTEALVFQLNDSTLIQQEPLINSDIERLQLQRVFKGKGYYEDDVLFTEPMDFSEKNYLPIKTVHGLMKRLHFPQKYKENERLSLDLDDRSFLLETMYQVPRKQGYDEGTYYDGYVKFFLFGDSKERIPDHIKIYNKVGYAYGYLTDCAYIVDEEQDIAYILTATIHVNEDQIFNDDVYEYDGIGIPFLATLGRSVHEHIANNK